MTLEHKTSHKFTFFEIEIYTSKERLLIQLSDDVWFVMIGQYLDEKIWNLRVQKSRNSEKLAF